MNRDEIYDHLAQVYLGKREHVQVKESKPRPNAWLVINVLITAFILTSVVYGLTAFLTQRKDTFKSRVVFALNNSPIRLMYAVGGDYPQVKSLTIAVPEVDVAKYRRLNLSLRTMNGNPGVLKVVLKNAREEQSSYYLQGLQARWQDYSIAFDEMNLTDLKSLKDISFVVEAWNAKDASGAVLIDNISFSN
ncbi:MAG: hypothetical protein V2A70_05185 [Candidatus Omnitrophota bacterium]